MSNKQTEPKRDEQKYTTEVNTKAGDLTCEVLGHDWVLLSNGAWKCIRCGAS